ncbi:MAG TPA: ABC transporter substrate-binding protein [Burkholderiales bacterium]|nr:ABC transporter substrate-binding protein [Burkholderiales bacterium]
MNKRRKLIAGLGGVLLAGPAIAFAQSKDKVWRVGILATRNRPALLDADAFGQFMRGMRELGYVEGKNLQVEFRWAEGKYERLSGLAAELVQLKVDVIVAAGAQDIDAARKATSTIPIVMATSPDPVVSGFAKTLAHPGGNITGLTNFTVDISPKLFEMLQSMLPKLSRLAVMMNPVNSSHAGVLQSVESAAQKAGVKVLPVEARSAVEIERAFSTMAQAKAGGVLVPRDGFYIQQLDQIAKLAAKHRLPSISGYRQYVEAGGLMSYGQNAGESFRRAATYVDKIFKGAKPGDLPIEQPTTFELYINGRTAKALGLTIPQSLRISADKVL